MLRLLGLIILLAGLGVVLWGIAGALGELGGLYTNAISSPLEDPTTSSGAKGEEAVSKAMIDHVIRATFGVPFVLLGSIMLFIGNRGKRRKARAKAIVQAMRR